ncbi:replication-associated recombination protein A [Ruminococcus albus]|uniref:Recombination factor protein RarA n=1 Tax=Ruminococcus albus 8 TaxID=246199 RepID=E9SEP0_RUMAL|nr:replication-associated recombination protein A [Ruminococcus albus]EGC02293.1 recombination factor protein RarA [Ruminococcus albus 8]MCC3351740.1 replication-associated recombination protein A [Ruminococcus albus 8]
MNIPLAEKIRPKTLDEIVGQTHLMGEGKPLRRIIESGTIPNLIFYGPSGVGKTTIARFIAENANMTMYKLNGTSASVADIKNIIAETEMLSGMNGILLYLDEIQYLNKKQQQSLLEYIENGSITLISSTTENPYFYVYNAIISRSTVFEFKPVTPQQIQPAIRRAFDLMAEDIGVSLTLEDGVIEHIARGCGGDVRKSINTVELCVLSAERDEENGRTVKMETVRQLTQRSNMRYDREGDEHYDILSALQKSIRGSDENAALHYAARLIEAGDIISLCRRLLVIASEDVGLAYPMAAVITKACVDSALQLGLPEARIPLAEAIIMLATSPKSNSAESAIDAALAVVRSSGALDFPRHLQNKHFDGAEAQVRGQHYLYPHDYPNHWVQQQYLPDALIGQVYYHYGDNKSEQAAKAYWQKIKGGR